MFFRPNQSPRAILSCEVALKAISPIVIVQALGEIFRLADVKQSARIFENVDQEHGSYKRPVVKLQFACQNWLRR